MPSNRFIRIGVALMSGALLILVLFAMWKFSRGPQQPAIVENNAATNNIAPVSMRSERRAAIALMDLPARSIITADMLKMEELPEGMSTVGMITNLDAQAVGFITNRPIRRNDRLRTDFLVGHISEVGIAGALQPGTRAMVVPIPSKPTLHDLVRVGDFVDIIAAFDQQESRTIIENVRVLAVDVFGKDYPVASVAMRGPFKAPGRSIPSEAPPANAAPSTPAGENQPGQAVPTPTPTPTPTPDAQANPPAPALTLEVTPEQANRISLAQNSGAIVDFLIVPRVSLPFIVPGASAGEVRVANVTRAQLAPYAEGKKNSGGNKAASTPRPQNQNSRPYRDVSDSTGFINPPIPIPESTISGGLPPAAFAETTPVQRPTYDIPIYADGTKVRIDTVLKPQPK